MKNSNILGHLATLFTITVWAMTFVSSKILLRTFDPVEILLLRFIMAYILLTILSPHGIGRLPFKKELCYAGAGISGICIYYILENVALTYTQASNVGIIISAVPFFTALVLKLFSRKEEQEPVTKYFFIGFVIAMTGICLISYNGASLHFNPLGDLLTIGAAIMWGFYTLFLKKVAAQGYSILQYTRRIFFYGLLGLGLSFLLLGTKMHIAGIANPINLLNLLFLGFVASAICFVTWNYGVEKIGAIKASAYIYLSPLITVIASAFILKESITGIEMIGMILILAGLILSENWFGKK